MTAARYGLVIRNARLLDGTGAPVRPGDLAVAGDRVAAVGDVAGAGAREIDGRGRVLCPGFIDTHTHDDGALLRYPGMQFKLAQGVTTCVTGNCGFSVAPATAEAGPMITRSAILGIGDTPVTWRDLAGYREAFAAARPAVNAIALAGMGTLRYAAMRNARGAPAPADQARMRGWVEQAMEQGACGLSTGLIYEPNRFSTTEEIIDLCREIAPHGGVYATHMRNEGEGLLDSIEETLRIGREAGCAMHISHHKASGRRAWGLVARSLARIEAARAAGDDVTLDVYPYPAGSTRLDALVRLGLFADPEYAPAIRIATCPGNEHWQGKTVAEVAEELDLPAEQAAQRIVEGPGRETVVIQFTMDETDVETNLRHPLVMIGSDGIPVLEGLPHPRLYGTFPRVLGCYVRERQVATLEEMVRRMTSFPAQRFGLAGRGVLAPGAFADLVLFDPATVRDTATYDAPQQEPEGIALVVVNGAIACEGGRHTGVGSGRLLWFGRE
jgi:N-acyl-D-aspartate/D-glutamate deacylase